LIYHITTAAEWEKAQTAGEVSAESFAAEGFIHCSRQAQLLAVANRFFPGASGLLVLAIDEESVLPWLVYEGPADVGDAFAQESFPHLYGPIPVTAIVAVADMPAGADGRHLWPTTLPKG
jgi:uncharacterized protein (DUF952 family)